MSIENANQKTINCNETTNVFDSENLSSTAVGLKV